MAIEASIPIQAVIGLLLICGLLLGMLASRYRLPRVAVYVLTGVLFSPTLLGGVLGIQVGVWAQELTSVSLGIIAYLIGGAITPGQLRRTGRIILVTSLAESLGACLLVAGVLWLTLPDTLGGVPGVYLALALGTIAMTTAPAATVGVLHQFHAHGPVSSTLLGVVALDDALGIILFALAVALMSDAPIIISLYYATAEVLGSLLLGGCGGYLLGVFARLLQQSTLRLSLVLGAVMLTVGVAEFLLLSPLLAAMALGFSSRLCLRSGSDRLFAPLEYFEELVFLIFFTVAGTHFDPTVFIGHVGLIGIYFSVRIVGKTLGAHVGARAAGAPPTVQRWLGFGLLPQAGVAVGLALTLAHQPVFASAANIILNIILGTTLLYELFGPFAVSYALRQAGEIGGAEVRHP